MKGQGTSKDPHGREPFPRDTPLLEVVMDTSGGHTGHELGFSWAVLRETDRHTQSPSARPASR